MNRLEINDLIMGSVFDSMKAQGFVEQAESGAKIYEVQRAEIIKEEGNNAES